MENSNYYIIQDITTLGRKLYSMGELSFLDKGGFNFSKAINTIRRKDVDVNYCHETSSWYIEDINLDRLYFDTLSELLSDTLTNKEFMSCQQQYSKYDYYQVTDAGYDLLNADFGGDLFRYCDIFIVAVKPGTDIYKLVAEKTVLEV